MCIWPQQVCARGTSTAQPSRSSSPTVALPTSGNKPSTRQVTNKATRTLDPPGVARSPASARADSETLRHPPGRFYAGDGRQPGLGGVPDAGGLDRRRLDGVDPPGGREARPDLVPGHPPGAEDARLPVAEAEQVTAASGRGRGGQAGHIGRSVAVVEDVEQAAVEHGV